MLARTCMLALTHSRTHTCAPQEFKEGARKEAAKLNSVDEDFQKCECVLKVSGDYASVLVCTDTCEWLMYTHSLALDHTYLRAFTADTLRRLLEQSAANKEKNKKAVQDK